MIRLGLESFLDNVMLGKNKTTEQKQTTVFSRYGKVLYVHL